MLVDGKDVEPHKDIGRPWVFVVQAQESLQRGDEDAEFGPPSMRDEVGWGANLCHGEADGSVEEADSRLSGDSYPHSGTIGCMGYPAAVHEEVHEPDGRGIATRICESRGPGSSSIHVPLLNACIGGVIAGVHAQCDMNVRTIVMKVGTSGSDEEGLLV